MKPTLANLSPSVTTMIRMDHTHVLATFRRYHFDTSPARKEALVGMACRALEIHAQLEEEIFYPAVAALQVDAPVVDKSVPEHDEMRRLIAKLREMESVDPDYDATFMELMRDVLHHVADEETTLLPDAEWLMPERLRELGARMTRRRLQLVAPYTREIAVNTAMSFPLLAITTGIGAAMALSSLCVRKAD